MKRTYPAILLLFIILTACTPDDVEYPRPREPEGERAIFVDPNFERYCLLEFGPPFPSEQLWLTVDDMKRVDRFSPSMNDSYIQKVTTLADMHLFENLESISFIYTFDQIKEVDLSNLRKLRRIVWYVNNGVTQLDLRNNSEMTNLSLSCGNLSKLILPDNCKIEQFMVANCKISSFDLRAIPLAKSISVGGCPVRELDLTPCPDIEGLNISETDIKTIDLSHCHRLESLSCTSCPYLTNVYISNIVKGDLSIRKDSHILITYVESHASIDPNGYLVIPDIRFENFLIEHYDTDKDGRVSTDEANRITEIDSRNDELRSLEGIQFMPNLQTLSCRSSNLADLDLSCNPKLETIVLTNNKLQKLDLTGCPELERLICDNNQLTSIDLSKSSKLKILNINKNHLNKLDLNGNTQLTSLSIRENQIASLQPGNKPMLELIDCTGCGTYDMNLSELPALKSLICQNTLLYSLDLSRNLQIHTLDTRSCFSLSTIFLKRGQVIENLQKENRTTIAYKD